MAKNRNAVTCNGRASFYACMWEDIRNCAMDNGWAVAIHGSLNSDMDIMAMPWVEEAVSFEELIDKISKLFSGNAMSEQYVLTYDEKAHNRVVATIPIWADFYLDISTILTTNAEVERLEYILQAGYRKVERGEWIPRNYTRHCSCGKSERVVHYECSACKRIAYNQPYGLSFCPNCGADMRKEDEK